MEVFPSKHSQVLFFLMQLRSELMSGVGLPEALYNIKERLVFDHQVPLKNTLINIFQRVALGFSYQEAMDPFVGLNHSQETLELISLLGRICEEDQKLGSTFDAVKSLDPMLTLFSKDHDRIPEPLEASPLNEVQLKEDAAISCVSHLVSQLNFKVLLNPGGGDYQRIGIWLRTVLKCEVELFSKQTDISKNHYVHFEPCFKSSDGGYHGTWSEVFNVKNGNPCLQSFFKTIPQGVGRTGEVFFEVRSLGLIPYFVKQIEGNGEEVPRDLFRSGRFEMKGRRI